MSLVKLILTHGLIYDHGENYNASLINEINITISSEEFVDLAFIWCYKVCHEKSEIFKVFF